MRSFYRHTVHTRHSAASPEYYSDLIDQNIKGHRQAFPGRPILFSAREAHRKIKGKARLRYLDTPTWLKTRWGSLSLPQGTAVLDDPELTGSEQPVFIRPQHQYPLIKAMIEDFVDVVSDVSIKAPLVDGLSITQYALRQQNNYEKALAQAVEKGRPEADLGNYAYFPTTNELFLLPEEQDFWFYTITSHSFFDSAQKNLSLYQIWDRFKATNIGVLGASVGSNIAVAGVKLFGGALDLADFDVGSAGGYKRMMGDLTVLTNSRAARTQVLNPYDLQRARKAIQVALAVFRINPYAQVRLYLEGATPQNLPEIIDRADVLFEEIDNIVDKIGLVRKMARQKRKPVLSLTDAGDMVGVEYNDYRQPKTPLANFISDKKLLALWKKARTTGSDMSKWDLAKALYGKEPFDGPWKDFIYSTGVHATTSIPQHPHGSLGAAYLAVTYAALYRLGCQLPKRAWFQPPKQYKVYP